MYAAEWARDCRPLQPLTSILALGSLSAVSEYGFVGRGSQARVGHEEDEAIVCLFVLNKHMLKVLFDPFMRTQFKIS